MIYVFPVLSSLAVIVTLGLVLVMKYHWHLMHNLIYHFQSFAIWIIVLQSLMVFRDQNFFRIANILPLLLLPITYYVLPFVWLLILADWSMETYWNLAKVYSALVALITICISIYGASGSDTNPTFRYAAIEGYSFVKTHYFMFFACILHSFYNVKHGEIDGFDITAFVSAFLFMVCALISVVKAWIDSKKVISDSELVVKFSSYPFTRDFKTTAMTLRYHIWMFAKQALVFLFIFLTWVSFKQDEYNGSSNAVAYTAVVISIEVLWFGYITYFRPAVNPEIAIVEISNFVFYLTILGLVITKMVDLNQHGLTDTKTYTFYIVMFTLAMPFAYFFLLVYILVKRVFLKIPMSDAHKRPTNRLKGMSVTSAENSYAQLMNPDAVN